MYIHTDDEFILAEQRNLIVYITESAIKKSDLERESEGSVTGVHLSRMDLGSWTIFSLLDKEFTAQIRLACVFGNLGNEALIVTRDGEVFALGSNGAGCLGLGDMHSTLTPKQVEALCYKKVLGFAYGSGPHVLGNKSKLLSIKQQQ